MKDSITDNITRRNLDTIEEALKVYKNKEIKGIKKVLIEYKKKEVSKDWKNMVINTNNDTIENIEIMEEKIQEILDAFWINGNLKDNVR